MHVGGTDFYDFKTEITLHVGDTHRCVPVLLRDDQLAEPDESFLIRLEETDKFAQVTIIDNDGNSIADNAYCKTEKLMFCIKFQSFVL